MDGDSLRCLYFIYTESAALSEFADSRKKHCEALRAALFAC